MAFLRRRQKWSDAPRKRHRRDGEASLHAQFFESSQVIKVLLYFAFALLVVIVCFVGLEESVPPVVAGQRAQHRVVSEFEFSYKSAIVTEARIREARTRVPPVYRLTMLPYEQFRDFIAALQDSLLILEFQLDDLPEDDRAETLNAFASASRSREGFRTPSDAIEVLLERTDPETREELFGQSLEILESILSRGVYVHTEPAFSQLEGQLKLLTVLDSAGNPVQTQIQPFTEAIFELNQRLRALSDAAIARALFAIFRTGLRSNLVYDLEATENAIRMAEESVEPVWLDVTSGESIIEPGAIVSPEDQEKLLAYRAALRERRPGGVGFDPMFFKRVLLTLGIAFSAVLYARVNRFQMGRQNRRLALAALSTLLSLGLIRLVLEVGETDVFTRNPSLLLVLPYAAPITFGPMIAVLLIGPSFAVLVGLLVGLFFAIMQGGSLDTFFLTLIASLVAIYCCREVRQRGTVVRAGAMAGLTVALGALFFGLIVETDPGIVARQVGLAVATGILTGILVVGVLPIIENAFQLTTEITLLELTDFNHPLLRRMQVEAPGSYHHSLMVSNLAENAAAAIGASPLVCRTCALFHDIGKLVKPEYFSENQRGGINPHLAQNPSMSALVIKAHVKEGVQLAREFRLPRIVIEVIRQHHGRTLIQYFYYEALKKSKEGGSTNIPFPEAPTIKSEEVDESTYRYDGPRPNFKESAIILFADSVEAASRSLRKVSPAAVEELLERIFRDRLEDGQLDECPITFQEIALIKKSFSFTLLNMLHSRVEYPSRSPESSQEMPEDEEDDTESREEEEEDTTGVRAMND